MHPSLLFKLEKKMLELAPSRRPHTKKNTFNSRTDTHCCSAQQVLNASHEHSLSNNSFQITGKLCSVVLVLAHSLYQSKSTCLFSNCKNRGGRTGKQISTFKEHCIQQRRRVTQPVNVHVFACPCSSDVSKLIIDPLTQVTLQWHTSRHVPRCYQCKLQVELYTMT